MEGQTKIGMITYSDVAFATSFVALLARYGVNLTRAWRLAHASQWHMPSGGFLPKPGFVFVVIGVLNGRGRGALLNAVTGHKGHLFCTFRLHAMRAENLEKYPLKFVPKDAVDDEVDARVAGDEQVGNIVEGDNVHV